MQARYYDPVIGRFLSIDPMPFMAAKPYMFNRYAYTGNNPMNRTDPTGMADDSDSDFDDDWGDEGPSQESQDFLSNFGLDNRSLAAAKGRGGQGRNASGAKTKKRHGFVDSVFETDKKGNIVTKGTGRFHEGISNDSSSGNFWDIEIVNLKGINGKWYEAFQWVGGHPGGQCNCHGTSVGGGQYWINNIMPIVNDFFVPTNQITVGSLVVWGGGQHFAILSSSGSSLNSSLVTGLGGQQTEKSTATVGSFVEDFGSPQAYRLR